MSNFITMCLRSVHSLHSFRFGGRCSCLTTRPPFTTLRSVHFTHLSTPRHRWFLNSTSQVNPHSIPLPGCFLSTHVVNLANFARFARFATFHPQKAFKEAPFHIHPLSRSIQSPPMPFSNAFPKVYFSHCGESTPLSAFQAERLVYYT